MRTLGFVVAATLGMACGGGGGGGGGGSSGSLVGTVHGQTFDITDTISAKVGSGNLVGASILLGTIGGICDELTADKIPANETGITIELLVIGSDGQSATAPTAPGTFNVIHNAQPSGLTAAVHVYVTDGSCADVTASEAEGSSGTVTLTAVSGDQFSGSYDVTLDSGDHVTGAFAPEACPGLQTAIEGSAAPACE